MNRLARIALVLSLLVAGVLSATAETRLGGSIQRTNDGASYPVDILRTGPGPLEIDNNQTTWIVIHGWNSSRNSQNIAAAAESIALARAGDQVLTLDWSAAANTGILDPYSAENSIVPVAEWAANALIQYGFAGTNLNLVGHSFGSYVADEIARRIPGGVHTIVTLDPAIDIPGGYDPVAEVDFARDSAFSWSFHSSSLGSDVTPATADEAFIVESNAPLIDAHSNVVWLFAHLVALPEDAAGNFTPLWRLLAGQPGPWLPNQYSSPFQGNGTTFPFEAVIQTTDQGRLPLNTEYVARPILSLAAKGGRVELSWSASYTGFVLQGSPAIGPTAKWTNVKEAETQVNDRNIVEVDPAGARFFRLATIALENP